MYVHAYVLYVCTCILTVCADVRTYTVQIRKLYTHPWGIVWTTLLGEVQNIRTQFYFRSMVCGRCRNFTFESHIRWLSSHRQLLSSVQWCSMSHSKHTSIDVCMHTFTCARMSNYTRLVSSINLSSLYID